MQTTGYYGPRAYQARRYPQAAQQQDMRGRAVLIIVIAVAMILGWVFFVKCDAECGGDSYMHPECSGGNCTKWSKACKCLCKAPKTYHVGNKKCVECPDRKIVGTLRGPDCICDPEKRKLCEKTYPNYPSGPNDPARDEPHGLWNEDTCSCTCANYWGGEDCNYCDPNKCADAIMVNAGNNSGTINGKKTCDPASTLCACNCGPLPADCQLVEADCGPNGKLPDDFVASRMDAENCQCVCDEGWAHSDPNDKQQLCNVCIKPDSSCPSGQKVNRVTCECEASLAEGNTFQSTTGQEVCDESNNCKIVNKIDRIYIRGSCSNNKDKNKCLAVTDDGTPTSKFCAWDERAGECYSICDRYEVQTACGADENCLWSPPQRYCEETDPTNCRDVPGTCSMNKPKIIPGGRECPNHTNQEACCADPTGWCEWYDGRCMSVVFTPVGTPSTCFPDFN